MLTITTEYRQNILFIRLNGYLTKKTLNILKQNVTNIIKGGGIRNIVINLENLDEIDVEGINELLYCYELCKKNQGVSLLCGNNDKIKSNIKQHHLLKYMYEISNELCAMKIINMRVK